MHEIVREIKPWHPDLLPSPGRAGMVELHARLLVGSTWSDEPLWVRAGSILAVQPRYTDSGELRGSRVLVSGEVWLLVAERAEGVLYAIERAEAADRA